MHYILNKDYRLRGWTDHLACLEYFPDRSISDLTGREYGLLSRCNGKEDVDTVRYAEAIKKFTERGVITENGDAELFPEQAYKFYENRRFRKIDLSITGFCNFKCKHCFNAADHKPRNVQPETQDILDLIARFDECGVAGFRINGGEPLLNRDFLKITGEIAKRGMIFCELISNIYHLTPETADGIKAQGHDPEIYISFDGLKYEH